MSRATPSAVPAQVTSVTDGVAPEVTVVGRDSLRPGMTDRRNGLLSVLPTGSRSVAAQRRGRYSASSRAHSDRMAPDLARQLILDYTAPGDLVLDPFAKTHTFQPRCASSCLLPTGSAERRCGVLGLRTAARPHKVK
jgi:hypothetical protein